MKNNTKNEEEFSEIIELLKQGLSALKTKVLEKCLYTKDKSSHSVYKISGLPMLQESSDNTFTNNEPEPLNPEPSDLTELI